MSPSFRQCRALPIALLLFAMLASVLMAALTPMAASAEGAPYKEAPGYPKYGCYDVVTGGNGMWSGNTPYPFDVNVPGPVVDAYLVWIGTEDVGAPNSPNQSDLDVNGTTVLGTLVDSTKPGAGDPWWYMWRADVGPNGLNLVKQGANKYSVAGWNYLADGQQRRNGIGLVVVYSTGACTKPNQIDLIDNFDYYWERQTGTTDVMAFTFQPTPFDRDVTLLLQHAGSDFVEPQGLVQAASPDGPMGVLPSSCRHMNLWAKTGNGTPPTSLVNYSTTPPSAANGGKMVVADPFVGANCASTTWSWPVTSLTGWQDGYGWKQDTGGYIAPEWSITKITVRVPANQTYVALQLESEKTGNPEMELTGESGAWFAQAVVPIQDVKLKIAKTDGVDTAKPGDTLTYTLSWENYGASMTNDTTIVDELPAGAAFVSASNGGAYDAGTNTVKWNLGNVAGGTKGTVTLALKLDPVFQAGTTTLTNKAKISTSTGGELDLSDNTATDTTDVVAKAELAVSKTGAPEPVDAGSNLTYTIQWTVGGNAYSDDVVVIDTLPANVSFVSASDGGTFAAGKVTWNLGNVTPVKTGALTLVVEVNSPQLNGTAINNSVTITNKAGDTATGTAKNTVRSDHELTITKTDDPDPVKRNEQLTYTINWGVTGNEPAIAVVVKDALPFGTTFVSASNGGTFDVATKTITWNLGDKVPGDTGSLTLVVKINGDFPPNLDIENTATVSDSKPGKDKTATEATKVVPMPGGAIGDTVWLDLNKNGMQEPGEPGLSGVGLILYSAGADGACGGGDDVAVANAVTDANGKYAFKNVEAGVYCVDVIDATVPAGLTLASGTDPRKVTLAVDQIYNDADFGYAPAAGAGVIGDRVWSDANGNGAQDAGEVGIGSVTLDLYNAGADAQCNTADDAKLASATTAADGSYLFAGLAAGKYCVRVTDTGGKLTGLTQTKAPTQPVNLAAGEVYLDADFGYQGLCGEVGDLVFYDANRNGVYEPAGGQEKGISGVTLSLTVGGPDGNFGTADDVTVATTTTDASGAYLFTGLASGNFQVVVTDVNGRLYGYTQSPGTPNTNDNGQTSPFPVAIDGCTSIRFADFGYADGHLLTIVKTNNLPVAQPVEAGAELIWTLTYSVSGRGSAPNVVITDQLPMQVDFVSASDGGTFDAATRVVTWHLGTVAPGTNGAVTLTVRVHKPLDNNSYIHNTAVITDDAKVRDQSSDIVRVHAAPILAVTKTNNPTGQVKPGDTITYEVCATNTGNGNATNAALTEVMPVNTAYLAGSAIGGASFNEATNTLSWKRPVFGPDEAFCGSFKVTVNMVITGLTGQANVAMTFAEWNAMTIDNTVTLTADGQTPKTASVSNPLDATVKPVIFKTADKTQVHQGDAVVFTITVRNEGTAAATNVVVTDQVPTRLDGVTVTATKGTVVYDPATRLITVTIGQLNPDESVFITVSGKAAYVKASETPYPLNNEAVMSFTEGAARTSNRVTITVVYFLPGEVPEPGTWLMLGTGLAGLAGYARARVQSRRRKGQK